MGRLLFFSFLVVLPSFSRAQFTYVLDQSVPVRTLQDVELSLAWAGGLNAAQINTMDLNNDGSEDLVIFDRMAGKVITFIGNGSSYQAAPEYETLFPSEITNWLLLRDYNCDGNKDIFTGDALGIKVFTNVTSDDGNLSWEPRPFWVGDEKKTVIFTEGNTLVNLQLQSDDLPSISDVDGDGDLDILNVQYLGSTVEFHQNMSAENGQPCDSMQFKRITRTWGNIRECGCGSFAFNGAPCPPNSGGRTKHAGGKSLLALDVNGDQQIDLLFSEAECNRLYLFQNEGTTEAPIINSAQPFPLSEPATFSIFPTPFFEDVDFDGAKDLVVSPGIFTREFFQTNLSQSTWFYKNNGSESIPSFSLTEKDFLQDRMIDVGDNAVPVITDVEGDGDYDLMISNNTSEKFTSMIELYQNEGTPEAPSFKLTQEDFLGFGSSKLFNLKIQLADINGDQTSDLVFTATNLDNNQTNLYFLNNKSRAGLDFSGNSVRLINFQLTSSENLFMTDINGDGLQDVLAGRSEGNLEYWRNTGSAAEPSFILENSAYLGFATSTLRQNISCAAGDLDADGRTDLVIGDQSGTLSIIPDFLSQNSEQGINADIVFNPIKEMYESRNLGGKIWPAIANLFFTRKPAIIVGNALGGVHLLRNDDGSSLPEDPVVDVYPNPVDKSGVITIRADRSGVMQLVSLLGQKLSPEMELDASRPYVFSIPPLSAGLYLVAFSSNNKVVTRKIVIR